MKITGILFAPALCLYIDKPMRRQDKNVKSTRLIP